MPSYNQQQLLYKVRTGNQCAILVGEQLIGFGQTVAPNQDFGTEALYGIGSPKPQEIQQLKFSQTITLDKYRLTAEGEQFFGETAPLWTLLCNNSFDIFLLDENGTAFLSYVGAVAQTNNLNIASNQPLTEGLSFFAMDVLDENGVSVLNGSAAANFNTLAPAAGIPFVVPGG